MLPLQYLVEMLVENVDNNQLTDAQFRELLRKTLPIVDGVDYMEPIVTSVED